MNHPWSGVARPCVVSTVRIAAVIWICLINCELRSSVADDLLVISVKAAGCLQSAGHVPYRHPPSSVVALCCNLMVESGGLPCRLHPRIHLGSEGELLPLNGALSVLACFCIGGAFVNE